MMKRIQRITTIILVIVIFFRFGFLIYKSFSHFQGSYWAGYEGFKNAYLNSQYIRTNPTASIPDETLYSYAAGAYLKGESLLDVNPGTPPLGKYLFSLSIILFDNPNTIMIVVFIFFIIGIFFLGKEIISSTFIVLILLIIILFQPLIADQLRFIPLLDIPMMTFQIWSIYFFIKGLKKNGFFILISMVLLGVAMMTKIFSISVPLLAIYTAYILLNRRKLFGWLLLGYLSIAGVAIVTYIPIYYRGYTPWNVLGIQKWSYIYNMSKLNRFLTVWDLIFFNRWHVWWGDQPVIHDANWHISWPVLFGLSWVWILKHTRSFFRLSHAQQIVYLWTIAYFIMISLNQSSARYLLPILPFTYILSADVLCGWYKHLRKILN
ncbi:glycosyltransferase family 39 protein [Candidatus Gottesmanbacteria bacterium]|nr:glycosyltransferase family 39 protein [Candidatus Gottesmanbacteria bacterium]